MATLEVMYGSLSLFMNALVSARVTLDPMAVPHPCTLICVSVVWLGDIRSLLVFDEMNILIVFIHKLIMLLLNTLFI